LSRLSDLRARAAFLLPKKSFPAARADRKSRPDSMGIAEGEIEGRKH
jgi:hypothetical protein